MVDEFDNRIRFPAPKIDFEDDVGTTGQDHDDYPEPGQARFDHMRMVVIGFLAHQSSDDDDEPTQRRNGTTWFPRTSKAYKYWNGSEFRPIAEAIGLTSGGTPDEILSLSEWFTTTQLQLEKIVSKFTWSGSSTQNGIDSIPVPESIKDDVDAVLDQIRPLVYIDGALVDPRNSQFVSCDLVELSGGVVINKNQGFTVITERFDGFVVESTVLP